ncbi:hypothetical protein B7P43_G08808 [Cryptotermes secundus]|uniref:DUF4780 domain-containing protein n=1 Tax=Cryptotermes secundus TaxID=105785 RepID=A0A2J7RJK4_9NEOP|nr:hypothetical protein B7P43_G08808 [Cryptotermes secundus]
MRKLKKARDGASKAGTGGSQQPGNVDSPKQGETPTGTFKRPRSEGSTPTELARALKRPRDSKGSGTYKEALANIKVAIFKETYPEDKLTEGDQDSILEELGQALCRTPLGELPHLKPYRLEGGALLYTCADQQSGQWLMRTIDNHRLKSGARLKITDTKNLPKPVKIAIRTKDKVVQNPDELLKWIGNLNPGLYTESWRILDRKSEPKGQRLILLIDRDSLSVIKETGYRVYTGLSQGTVRVLQHPEEQWQKEMAVPSSIPSGSASEGEGDDVPSPSVDRKRGCDEKETIPPLVNPILPDQGPPLEETRSDK